MCSSRFHHRADRCEACQESLDLTLAVWLLLAAIALGSLAYVWLTS